MTLLVASSPKAAFGWCFWLVCHSLRCGFLGFLKVFLGFSGKFGMKDSIGLQIQLRRYVGTGVLGA